jgi:hypothetical protein
VTAVRIEDRHSATEFSGELIASADSRDFSDRREDRWVEMRIYRLDGQAAAWILHRAGMSRIYHADLPLDDACKTISGRASGDLATVDDLPDDAVPCPSCQPPEPLQLHDREQIRFEFPRNTVDRCASPAVAVERLTTMRDRRTGTRTTMISEPVAALLAQASASDPDFAAAPKPVDRIM